jgi:replicative DNA helicase
LATPEGATAVWQSRLNPDVLPVDEEMVRDALTFVLDYMDDYREPPNVSVLSEEIGVDEFNEPIAPIEYVMAKLRERYKKRQVTKVVREAGKKIAKGADPNETISFGIEELTRLRLESSDKKISTDSTEMDLVLEEYFREEEDESLITTGFDEIDKHIGGLKGLNILLARPKRYKSWLLLNSAVATFEAQVGNIEFVTLELAAEEMMRRFCCMATDTSWANFQSKTLRDKDVQFIRETAEMLKTKFPHKLHMTRLDPGDRSVKNIVAGALERGAAALYIDQLSWLDGARDERYARHRIGEAMEQLKDATQYFPIYMAAQLNREASGIDGLADISQIAEADFVGQTADNLFAIHASKDAMSSTPRIIQHGLIESRSYEPKAWEVSVKLNENSSFKLLQELAS